MQGNQAFHGHANRPAGYCADCDRSPLAPSADVIQNHFATMRPRAVFGQINALPTTESECPGLNRNVNRSAGQHGLHMSRHVVRTFGIVNPSGIGWRQAVECGGEIGAHVRVGVLLDHQRGRGVADEHEHKAVACATTGNEILDFLRNVEKALPASLDDKRRGTHQFGSDSGDRGEPIHDIIPVAAFSAGQQGFLGGAWARRRPGAAQPFLCKSRWIVTVISMKRRSTLSMTVMIRSISASSGDSRSGSPGLADGVGAEATGGIVRGGRGRISGGAVSGGWPPLFPPSLAEGGAGGNGTPCSSNAFFKKALSRCSRAISRSRTARSSRPGTQLQSVPFWRHEATAPVKRSSRTNPPS